jgi:hypothetical protein
MFFTLSAIFHRLKEKNALMVVGNEKGGGPGREGCKHLQYMSRTVAIKVISFSALVTLKINKL